ncbi:MAG TPA: F0F1 ATP synthase subunit A [Candidatus Limnocylindrales bacterium]|nr:F0F1 ATP synthase subunit A [Candidatus Limnocylindrales bacterium]
MTDAQATTPTDARSPSRRNLFIGAIVAVIVLDILAAIFVPPFPKGEPGQPITGIGDLITANLEFPAPHVVFDLDQSTKVDPEAIVFNHTSISAPLFTMWFVIAFLVIAAVLMTRGLKLLPGRAQNAIEWAYESLENWATALGGDAARRHVPLFATFFLFILFSNWSGLLPFFGRIEAFRAPTSDVNVTLGLALVAFVYFHYQGFRTLGVRGYLGKFFVFSGFKEGLGAGVIALFVGLIEFLLEFIKPVTLSMRLFGNIFGGEVALGVITALTIAIIPIGMLSLELLLNFVQALIFSTLMLMYTIIAVESHDGGHEEEHAGAIVPETGAPPLSGAQPAH